MKLSDFLTFVVVQGGYLLIGVMGARLGWWHLHADEFTVATILAAMVTILRAMRRLEGSAR